MYPVRHTYSNSGVLALCYLIFQPSFKSPFKQALDCILLFFLLQIMRNSAAVQKALKNSVCPDLLSTP